MCRLQVGSQALPKISKVVGLVKDRQVVGWSQADELPVSCILPNSLP